LCFFPLVFALAYTSFAVYNLCSSFYAQVFLLKAWFKLLFVTVCRLTETSAI
jgi:hypothetical protein